jgi:hypothetical protein
MDPAKIKGATAVLGAPAGWDHERDGECGALAIREIGNPRHGSGFVESAWEPTEVERAQIAAGHHVILRIYGWQPPVAVYVDPQEPESQP